MKIEYSIQFLDFWALGSGFSGGSKYDSAVIVDENGLPFIPGKTIKGILRQNAEMLFDKNSDFIKSCFGFEGDGRSICHFSNLVLTSSVGDYKHLLFSNITNIKIDESGITKDGSLREMEVVLPLKMDGEIIFETPKFMDEMKTCIKTLRRMGLKRNRGLGRLKAMVKEGA